MPRKHLIASQTNKKQQSQAKMWLKLAREIKAAAKVCGPNPEANPRLKAAIEKALAHNLSRDSIERNISGVNKDPNELINLSYECYGPLGSQFIIDVLTDNQNRIASNLRGYLSKIHGEIAKQNSVKKFFDLYGDIIVVKNQTITVDNVFNKIATYNIIEIFDNDDNIEIYCSTNDFYHIKDVLLNNNYQLYSADIKLIPQEIKKITDQQILEKIKNFIIACENDDDIQTISTNVDLD